MGNHIWKKASDLDPQGIQMNNDKKKKHNMYDLTLGK